MKKGRKFLVVVEWGAVLLGFVVGRIEKGRERKAGEKGEKHQHYGIYEEYLKRPFDFAVALIAFIFSLPVYLVLVVLVRIRFGKPVLFKQERPGRYGKIFKLYKFRTMTEERNEKGELLPDEERLTAFGKTLRATSLDELPELLNILKGDMSIVGPRPLLIEYLSLYNERQKRRHEVRPGLTGLAQVHGRNAISWEEKFEWDVKYVEKVSFWGDIKIILKTVILVLKKEGIHSDTSVTMEYFTGNRP